MLCERARTQSLIARQSSGERSLYGLSIAPVELLDQANIAATRSVTATDSVLDYYLHTSGGVVTVAGGDFGEQSIQSIPIPRSDQDFFNAMVRRLDSIIDLDFRQVSGASSADVDLYYDSEINLDGSGNTLGLATTTEQEGWELFVNYPEIQDDENYLRYVLIHEFGHSLGLEHPFEDGDGDAVNGNTDPWLSAYPEETVMAYRNPLGDRWPEFFTDNDLAALIQTWGAEQQWLTSQADVVTGAAYAEKIAGLSGDDRIVGAGGADVINGNLGDDWLQGAFGRDQLFGGGGNDVLRGGNAGDELSGGGGSDLLVGGGGDDTLTGGTGDDRFRLTIGDDLVTDFNVADGDQLQLQAGSDYAIELVNGEIRLSSNQGSLTLVGVSEFDPAVQLEFF